MTPSQWYLSEHEKQVDCTVDLLAIGSSSPPEMIARLTGEHASGRVNAACSSALQHISLSLLQSRDLAHYVLHNNTHINCTVSAQRRLFANPTCKNCLPSTDTASFHKSVYGLKAAYVHCQSMIHVTAACSVCISTYAGRTWSPTF